MNRNHGLNQRRGTLGRSVYCNRQPGGKQYRRRLRRDAKKIEWAVKRLGYNPNLAARSLKLRSAKLLGLIVPDIENAYYATIAKHLEAEASAQGFSLILCNSHDEIKAEEHYLKLLAGRLVDGVFVCRGFVKPCNLPGQGGNKLNVVMLEKNRESDKRPAVMVDNCLVGRLAAAHLLGLGHKRLAIIMDKKIFCRLPDGNALSSKLRQSTGSKFPPPSLSKQGQESQTASALCASC